MKRKNKKLAKYFTASITTATLVLQNMYAPGTLHQAAAKTDTGDRKSVV